jgi:predicted phage terminase large subunit-like protein
VICVAGYNKDDPDTIWIRDIIHGRYGFPDLIALLEQTQKYYRAKFLCIEQAASGQSLIQVLERETKVHCHKFKPLKSKTIRLQTVAPLFEAGRVKFIDGEWTDAFFKEITSFPFVPHDDQTDAVVWALTYYSFHLDKGLREVNAQGNAFRSQGRSGLFDEFTEQKPGNNRGRRTMFSDVGGDLWNPTQDRRLSRSNDLKYDTGM